MSITTINMTINIMNHFPVTYLFSHLSLVFIVYENTFYTTLDSSTKQKVVKAIGQMFGKNVTALQLHELPFLV